MEFDTAFVALALLVLSCSCTRTPHVAASRSNIMFGDSITGDQKLISGDGSFALGFFTPANSTFKYLGIWYNTYHDQTVIWVANRESPVPHNSTANFTVGDDGNLVVFSEKGALLWSSNVTGLSSNSTVGALLKNGNLVLRHEDEFDNNIWESFEHPSDTCMPEMEIRYNRTTGQRTLITCWTSNDDPRPGNFSFGIDLNGYSHFYIWNQERIYYKFADWDEFTGGNTGGVASYISTVRVNDGVFFTFDHSKRGLNVRFVLKPNGTFQVLARLRNDPKWGLVFQAPQVNCELYQQCGPFGSCQIRSSGLCRCLTGFEPRSPKDWADNKWNGGCVRKEPLGCNDGDTFSGHENLKLPDHAISLGNVTVKDCKARCITNCSCTAYSYLKTSCFIWSGDLMDLADDFTHGRVLYVRERGLGNSVQQQKITGNLARRHKIIRASEIVSATFGVVLLMCGFAFIFKRNYLRRPDWKGANSGLSNSMTGASLVGKDEMKLVQYSLQHIRDATNNFHEDNKLGQGGFGPVFKGFLPEYGDVAIKMLSKRSAQGHEEFLNELKLIAKLQHKNLVSLLGCCVEGEEKILIYEYMPNRSLDKFLFDISLKATLDWNTRWVIIEGIAQGMLYLHKYSRLKVIHRDLKVSNILLDQEMIPKISDFGMARIFGTDQTQANTKRVVGTYGYISPEYVVYGQFSEKSDVFSFGVLLLEILTGERNSDFVMTEVSVSLLGWAWNKWKEGRMLELIDASIRETCDWNKATRSILVGLLCVQEIPADRPTMSDIAAMLSNETAPVPEPKEPAFRYSRQSRQLNDLSINEMTTSLPEPR